MHTTAQRPPNKTLTAAEAVLERGVSADVASAIEHDVAVAEVDASAVGSTAAVDAEGLQRREDGDLVDGGPLVPGRRRGRELVVADAGRGVFGQQVARAGGCPLWERGRDAVSCGARPARWRRGSGVGLMVGEGAYFWVICGGLRGGLRRLHARYSEVGSRCGGRRGHEYRDQALHDQAYVRL